MHWNPKVWTFWLPLGKDALQWLCEQHVQGSYSWTPNSSLTPWWVPQQMAYTSVLGYFRYSTAPPSFSLNSRLWIWIAIIQPLNISALQLSKSGAKPVSWLQLGCVGPVVFWHRQTGRLEGQLLCVSLAALQHLGKQHLRTWATCLQTTYTPSACTSAPLP